MQYWPTFIIETSMKSVCAYNQKMKYWKIVNRIEDINQLGKISLRFDKILGCKNKDKPFFYKKQVNKILAISKEVYEQLSNQL